MNVDIIELDPREIKLLDVNARFMRHEQYAQLVENVRKDGALTSTPFCWFTPDGRWEVLSGNHRVQAAVDAELPTIRVLATRDPLTHDERVGIQISHNSIAGEDDPATLKQLYESIQAVDLRKYAGLDDKTLELLDQVDLSSLNEANLDYATVQIVFLPHELEDARKALDDAMTLAKHDERWLALIGQNDQVLDALEAARNAGGVQNTATALGIILHTFNAHISDLRDYWLDETTYTPRRGNSTVPLETITGTRGIPGDAAAVIAMAVDRIARKQDLGKHKWRALELLAADYLAGPDDD